jgi:hypothetical protein
MEEKMENYRRELERELAGLKKTYRNSNLERETARYVAGEIKALEEMLYRR